MGWLIGTIVVVGSVTAIAAKLLSMWWPAESRTVHILLSAASFPALTFVLGAFVIALQFAQRTPDTHAGQFGMPIFALVMFWFYGLMAALFVGLPTAIVAVRAFHR